MRNLLAPFALLTTVLTSFATASPAYHDYQFTLAKKHDGGSILDRLRDEHDFSRFVKVIEKDRGLRDELDSDKHMTLFAPTNEAMKRFEEHHGGRRLLGSGGGDDDDHRDDFKKMLKYHLVPDHAFGHDDLFNGQLLKTDLKLKELDGGQQRIRVSMLRDDVFLNMYSKVVREHDIEAENGRILGIDRVLVPPQEILETLYAVPTEFSTTIAALCRIGGIDKIEKMQGVTFLVPDNKAWENLGFHNLYYLFSENGEKDLKEILKYHISDDLVYSTKIMRDHKVKLHSMYKDHEIEIEARKRQGGESKKHRHHQKRNHDDDDHKEHHPDHYIFNVNDGEARIRFTDGVSENGVIHIINQVLIPDDIDLPHDSDSDARRI
ncbi:hypothetical protein HDV05_002894 [Chytridiales sp. JEL 0842]|nr:hypothetical protein HDV05_002894 [Chytridiales sp. JEL 0842]